MLHSIKKVRAWLILFIMGLLASGVTAFPLAWESTFLVTLTKEGSLLGGLIPGLSSWAAFVDEGIHRTYKQYPFMAYGTDWLAFAHIVIATAFIGPIKDPIKNIWVIQFGMIACFMVFPLAIICGPIRHIPLYWILIDCSFGALGILPLYICYKYILKLEQIISKH